MSISNTTNKVIYQGDGSTTEFPFSFRIFEETDLVVSLYEIATGIETELTLNSDYTVTINGDNGGTVIMATAPSSSYKLIIKRILPLTQETDYVEGDPFPAESHERALDKLTMITQQLNEQLDRTVKVDITQTSVDTTLPIPEALKFLRWNSDASKLENASGITSIEYPSTISLGLDANKPTNPAQGDIYIATDSQKVYVCHSTGTWTEYKVNILSGTDANKPTTYKQDRFYWATDTKKLYWDNGSSWADISAQLNADKVDNKDASDFFQKAGAGEINALTEKTTLSNNDIVLIEDSEDNYAKKKAKKSSFGVADGSVSQAKLKTATGEVSLTSASTVKVGIVPASTGGGTAIYDGITSSTYASYICLVLINSTNDRVTSFLFTAPGGQYGFWAEGRLSGTTGYAQQRYITASGKDHWIFLLIAKTDLYDEQGRLTHKKGDLIASYQAPDHPCANQGGATELEIPHPFSSYDPEKHEIVLVDNKILNNIKERVNRRRSLLTIINEDCVIDDTQRPVFEPREIVKINEYPDEPIGEVKARIKTPQWAKIMIQPDKITLEQRIVEKLPDYILYKSLWIKK